MGIPHSKAQTTHAVCRTPVQLPCNPGPASCSPCAPATPLSSTLRCRSARCGSRCISACAAAPRWVQPGCCTAGCHSAAPHPAPALAAAPAAACPAGQGHLLQAGREPGCLQAHLQLSQPPAVPAAAQPVPAAAVPQAHQLWPVRMPPPVSEHALADTGLQLPSTVGVTTHRQLTAQQPLLAPPAAPGGAGLQALRPGAGRPTKEATPLPNAQRLASRCCHAPPLPRRPPGSRSGRRGAKVSGAETTQYASAMTHNLRAASANRLHSHCHPHPPTTPTQAACPEQST